MPFCPFIHNNIEVKTDGSFTPCCISSKRFNVNGKQAHATTETIKQVYDSPDRAEWIANFDQHFESDCSQCAQVERAGGESKRLREIERWKHFEKGKLQSLDLKLGNTCNLACAICGSHSSSKWRSIDKQFQREAAPLQDWQRRPQFWDQLAEVSQDVRRVELSGGEPFMIKEQKRLLKFLVDEGLAPQIEITWFTNCTQYPEDIVQYFEHFEHAGVMLSLDNTGPQFEFQRWPARWDETYDVFKKLIALRDKDTLHVGISHSISGMNVYHLPAFHRWARDHEVNVFNNIVMSPLNMQDLPYSFKQKVIEQFEGHDDPSFQTNPALGPNNWVTQFMMTPGDPERFRRQLVYPKQTRPGLFERAFPELLEHLND